MSSRKKMFGVRNYWASYCSFDPWFIFSMIHFLDGFVGSVNEKMRWSRYPVQPGLSYCLVDLCIWIVRRIVSFKVQKSASASYKDLFHCRPTAIRDSNLRSTRYNNWMKINFRLHNWSRAGCLCPFARLRYQRNHWEKLPLRIGIIGIMNCWDFGLSST